MFNEQKEFHVTSRIDEAIDLPNGGARIDARAANVACKIISPRSVRGVSSRHPFHHLTTSGPLNISHVGVEESDNGVTPRDRRNAHRLYSGGSPPRRKGPHPCISCCPTQGFRSSRCVQPLNIKMVHSTESVFDSRIPRGKNKSPPITGGPGCLTSLSGSSCNDGLRPQINHPRWHSPFIHPGLTDGDPQISALPITAPSCNLKRPLQHLH